MCLLVLITEAHCTRFAIWALFPFRHAQPPPPGMHSPLVSQLLIFHPLWSKVCAMHAASMTPAGQQQARGEISRPTKSTLAGSARPWTVQNTLASSATMRSCTPGDAYCLNVLQLVVIDTFRCVAGEKFADSGARSKGCPAGGWPRSGLAKEAASRTWPAEPAGA